VLTAAATRGDRHQPGVHAVVPAFSAPTSSDRSGCRVKEPSTARAGTSPWSCPRLGARPICLAVVLVRSPEIRRMVVLLPGGTRSQAPSDAAPALRICHSCSAEASGDRRSLSDSRAVLLITLHVSYQVGIRHI